MTVTRWDDLPLVLGVRQIAALYGLHAKTVRQQIGAGAPSLPTPVLDRPYRWRRDDVQRHLATVSLEGVRRARRMRGES